MDRRSLRMLRGSLTRTLPPPKEKPKPVWNSLEVAKLLSSLLVPLTLGGLGIWINLELRATQDRREREAIVVEFEKKYREELSWLLESESRVGLATEQEARVDLFKSIKSFEQDVRKLEGQRAGLEVKVKRELFQERRSDEFLVLHPLERLLSGARKCIDRRQLRRWRMANEKKHWDVIKEKTCTERILATSYCLDLVVMSLNELSRNPKTHIDILLREEAPFSLRENCWEKPQGGLDFGED